MPANSSHSPQRRPADERMLHPARCRLVPLDLRRRLAHAAPRLVEQDEQLLAGSIGAAGDRRRHRRGPCDGQGRSVSSAAHVARKRPRGGGVGERLRHVPVLLAARRPEQLFRQAAQDRLQRVADRLLLGEDPWRGRRPRRAGGAREAALRGPPQVPSRARQQATTSGASALSAAAQSGLVMRPLSPARAIGHRSGAARWPPDVGLRQPACHRSGLETDASGGDAAPGRRRDRSALRLTSRATTGARSAPRGGRRRWPHRPPPRPGTACRTRPAP